MSLLYADRAMIARASALRDPWLALGLELAALMIDAALDGENAVATHFTDARLAAILGAARQQFEVKRRGTQ